MFTINSRKSFSRFAPKASVASQAYVVTFAPTFKVGYTVSLRWKSSDFLSKNFINIFSLNFVRKEKAYISLMDNTIQ